MIWSFVKIVIFVALVAAAALGAGHLMETGGDVRLSLANMEFSLGPVQAIVGALLLLAALWLVLKAVGLIVAVLRFLNGDETAISRYFGAGVRRRPRCDGQGGQSRKVSVAPRSDEPSLRAGGRDVG
jgi:HemY protein